MADATPTAASSQEQQPQTIGRIFVSWSGPRSKAIARMLREWLPVVLQQIEEPFMSDDDTEKGSAGVEEIGRQLGSTTFGIFCLTPENQAAPWINYEAGAISKKLGQGKERVWTVLWELDAHQVHYPLAHFQFTKLTERDDVYRLVRSINLTQASPVKEDRLRRAFDAHWPSLDSKLRAEIPKIAQTAPKPLEQKQANETQALLHEVLVNVRYLMRLQAQRRTEYQTEQQVADPVEEAAMLRRRALEYTTSEYMAARNRLKSLLDNYANAKDQKQKAGYQPMIDGVKLDIQRIEERMRELDPNFQLEQWYHWRNSINQESDASGARP